MKKTAVDNIFQDEELMYLIKKLVNCTMEKGIAVSSLNQVINSVCREERQKITPYPTKEEEAFFYKVESFLNFYRKDLYHFFLKQRHNFFYDKTLHLICAMYVTYKKYGKYGINELLTYCNNSYDIIKCDRRNSGQIMKDLYCFISVHLDFSYEYPEYSPAFLTENMLTSNKEFVDYCNENNFLLERRMNMYNTTIRLVWLIEKFF